MSRYSAEEFYIASHRELNSNEKQQQLHTFYDMIEFAINYNHLQEQHLQEEDMENKKVFEIMRQALVHSKDLGIEWDKRLYYIDSALNRYKRHTDAKK